METYIKDMSSDANKVLDEVESLLKDMENDFNQDATVKKRISEIRQNSSIGKNEEELNAYLKKRGVKID